MPSGSVWLGPYAHVGGLAGPRSTLHRNRDYPQTAHGRMALVFPSWTAIQRFFRSVLLGRPRLNAFDEILFVDSARVPSPDPLPGQLQLVGSGNHAKWIRFRCPCGCGELLALNLMASHSPRWSFALDANRRVSVSPSVHATTCGAHFVIRASRVDWA